MLSPAISSLAPHQLRHLAGRYRVDLAFGDSQAVDNFLIQNADPSGGHPAHCELLVAGHSQLAHDKDIKWCVERASHLEGDRNAAAR
ncbi:MAG: hypothetical protein WA709_13790 [Stellaceae bacterium]